MRIAKGSAQRLGSDLTARARIRDAAIECFAQDGFDTGIRAIAARADVSPGLVTHHFGSKSALRAACDEEVLRRYHSVKAAGVAHPSAALLDAISAPGISATITVYLLRAVLAGGQPARDFLDRLVEDLREVMTGAVAAGLVRASRDEEARLRYLTYQALGGLIVRFVTTPGLTPEEFVASLRTGTGDVFLPMLELYTEGLLTEGSLLDDYVDYLSRAPNVLSATNPLPSSRDASTRPADKGVPS